MKPEFKSIIKKIVPNPVISKLLTIRDSLKVARARRIFKQAPETPIWVDWDVLDTLQQKYPFPPKKYGYDPQSLEKRGKERAESILRLIDTETETINTFLELGCWDGMICCFLQRNGKTTTAIDIRSEGFDERAAREGVRLLQMDAAHLQFQDESFDFVFSYASFEHFADPELVLQEAIRVVKSSGYIYLAFTPLYMSPQGLHVYDSITVPYCQFLFPKGLLQKFANAKGLPPLDFTNLNGWSLEDFRKMWNRYSHKLKKVKYKESFDISHLDLIMQYPSCFKSKNKFFDNLIVDGIEVLFKKIGG